MIPTQQELRHFVALASAFLSFVLVWITYALQWLRESLGDAGVPRTMQIAVLLGVLVLLVIAGLRALGGLLRLLFIIVAGLLVARALGLV